MLLMYGLEIKNHQPHFHMQMNRLARLGRRLVAVPLGIAFVVVSLLLTSRTAHAQDYFDLGGGTLGIIDSGNDAWMDEYDSGTDSWEPAFEIAGDAYQDYPVVGLSNSTVFFNGTGNTTYYRDDLNGYWFQYLGGDDFGDVAQYTPFIHFTYYTDSYADDYTESNWFDTGGIENPDTDWFSGDNPDESDGQAIIGGNAWDIYLVDGVEYGYDTVLDQWYQDNDDDTEFGSAVWTHTWVTCDAPDLDSADLLGGCGWVYYTVDDANYAYDPVLDQWYAENETTVSVSDDNDVMSLPEWWATVPGTSFALSGTLPTWSESSNPF